MERRAHWSDDLIDAVNACLDTSGDTITFDAYGVIAAVEDWELGFHAQTEGVTHSAECWRWHRECARTLIEQQQAANRQRCLDSAIKHPTAISSCKPWTESAMSEWDGCYCGEFAQPTIAPDEFGETCFHEHDKCEVPTTKVPDQTVIRLLRQKVDRMTERARKAEAAIQRVRGIVDADQTVPIDARDPASYVAGYADATFRVRQVLDGGQR